VDTPTPLSVSSVLLSADELLSTIRQELERSSFRHPERAKELRQLRAAATALTSRLAQLVQRGEDAALWEISLLLKSVRELERRLAMVTSQSYGPS
jgi:hypothetical protein